MPSDVDGERMKHLLPNGPVVIGEESCKKASCNQIQEFPDGDDPYCLGHSYAEWKAEGDSNVK